MMSITSALVTGGAGFIGSHLVEALVAGGCRVSVLDNLSSRKLANLDPVAPRIRFIRGDIRDPAAIEEAVSGCEVVFHLAAVVSVPKTTEDPLGPAAVNEIGSLQALEAARSGQARRLVFASSSAVYGSSSWTAAEWAQSRFLSVTAPLPCPSASGSSEPCMK